MHVKGVDKVEAATLVTCVHGATYSKTFSACRAGSNQSLRKKKKMVSHTWNMVGAWMKPDNRGYKICPGGGSATTKERDKEKSSADP